MRGYVIATLARVLEPFGRAGLGAVEEARPLPVSTWKAPVVRQHSP